MAVAWLRRLAARAAPSVYPCVGPDKLPAVDRLFLSGRVRRAISPRHGAILLVAGTIPDEAAAAVDRLHDQLPRPRATFAWDGSGDPTEDLIRLWRQILDGADEDDRQPDEPPNRWRGKGDHGQGGEGMMGGTPYGRPMAMTGEDVRDGLMLDRYTARVGPFAPMLPPGLQLELTLQGDVVAASEVLAPPFQQPPEASEPPACVARLLRLVGLDGDADRVLRGRAPSGLLALRALPRGLGRVAEGDDVRTRLGDWLAGRPGTYQAPRLPDLLAGAEWHEATLILASFAPDALRRACLAEAAA